MGKVIDIKNVTWKREGKAILSDVNWTVNKGEHWAILGLNGSGKTTLLNMVNGYIWPSTGEVNVLGYKFGSTDLRELRKSIGWVSSSLQARLVETSPVLNIVLSGKFSSIGLYDKTTEKDRKRAMELLEKLGCGHLIGRNYETCSQGEKQKILIARGLMGSPKLLILDEPTNGLDFLSREDLLRTIEQFTRQEDAPTIIFVTHHVEEILPVFSKTLLLREGSVFKSGWTEEILTSETLSDFFQTSVDVETKNSRAHVALS